MATESSPALLLVVLVLGIFADSCKSQELRCQCIHTSSDIIPPKFIQNVQVIPEGVECSRQQIIVTLKTGELICVDPEAEWVKIIQRLLTGSPN